MMRHIITLNEFNRVLQDDADVQYPMDTPIDQNDTNIRDYSPAEQFVYYVVLTILKNDVRFRKLEFERLQVFKKNNNKAGLLLNDIFDTKTFFDAFYLFTGIKFMNKKVGKHYYKFEPSDIDGILDALDSLAPNEYYVKILHNLKSKVKTTVNVEFAPFTDNDIPGVKIKI